MDWEKGEIVYCWSSKMESFFKGIVEYFDKEHLRVRAFVNGKCYTFNSDGSAITQDGRCTNKRVFSIRELNEVFSDS